MVCFEGRSFNALPGVVANGCIWSFAPLCALDWLQNSVNAVRHDVAGGPIRNSCSVFLRVSVRRFEAASTDLAEVERKKQGLDNAIDRLMDEVSRFCARSSYGYRHTVCVLCVFVCVW